ncbi:MAG TPA: DUF1349 domain-containing protein [Ohtaekwangia sp.]
MKLTKPFLASLLIVHSLTGLSQSEKFRINSIPTELTWRINPIQWKFEKDTLTIHAGAKTDLFIDPQDEYSVDNSPRALLMPAPPFLLSCRVDLDFAADYDAGVLMLYAEKNTWAKFCFEFSPEKKPNVVSVVNRQVSDDCNHAVIENNAVYLRIAGLGNNNYAFHYSTDGRYWKLVRYFSLESKSRMMVGFSAQSPTGEKCTAKFSSITFDSRKLSDLRNGE